MADNVIVPATGSGTATPTIETVDTTGSNGPQRQVMTVSPRTGAGADAIGSLTETAPGTDTASSGLNGRLQRVAQRLSSLIALIPASLTGGGNFKVSIAESTATIITSASGTTTVNGTVGISGTVPVSGTLGALVSGTVSVSSISSTVGISGTVSTVSGTLTPSAGINGSITTGGTAVIAISGPIQGGFITNPSSAAAQNIANVENLYLDMVTTPPSTDAAFVSTTSILAPGQSFDLPALAAGVNVRVNAATSAHRFTCVKW